MATFVLVHGAGDAGWYWHLTEAELRARGHQTIAPDLPCDRDTASLDDYAAAVANAAAGRRELVIVGQSYGAFTATLAARPATRTRSSATTTEYRVRWPRRPCAGAGAGNPRRSGTRPGHWMRGRT